MDIPLSSDALDIAHHPDTQKNILVAGLISGKVQLINYDRTAERTRSTGELHQNPDAKGYSKLWTARPSNKSCRGVSFHPDGSSIWSLGKDGSIIRLDTETGSVVSLWSKAHETAPSRLLPIDSNLLATGDDDGVVSLWDPRRPVTSGSASAVRSYMHHFDWITSMLWCPHLLPAKQPKLSKEEEERKKRKEEKKRKKKQRKNNGNLISSEPKDSQQSQRERLVCTSGDGTLSVIDIRAGKAGVDVSEDQEDELLSLASVKRNTKLVVGTQLGILSVWSPSRGLLDHVDRVPGHPASVDTLCTLDDDTILTGSSDGLVRVVQILPHKLLGIVADHGGMPVERISRQGNWLASIGHGPEIKLTDLSPLLEGDSEDEDEVQTETPAGNLSGSDDEDKRHEKTDRTGIQKVEESESDDEAAMMRSNKRVRPVTLSNLETSNVNTKDSFFSDL